MQNIGSTGTVVISRVTLTKDKFNQPIESLKQIGKYRGKIRMFNNNQPDNAGKNEFESVITFGIPLTRNSNSITTADVLIYNENTYNILSVYRATTHKELYIKVRL